MNGLQQHSMYRVYPINGTNLNEFDMQSPELAKQLMKYSVLEEFGEDNLAKHFYANNVPAFI